MKPADVGLAVLVAVIWGLAFVASRIALDEFSPTLMTTLRFAIAAVPCLFVRKPDVSWPLLIAISFTLFLGQFLAQAYGIAQGVPVGLTSVIVQSQALFTIGFAAALFGERPSPMQTAGIGIAVDTAADDPGAGAQRDGVGRMPARGEHRTDHVGLIAFQPDVERVTGNTEPGRRDHGPVGETPLMLVMPPRPRRERISEAEVESRDDPHGPCYRLARNRHSACFCGRVRLAACRT